MTPDRVILGSAQLGMRYGIAGGATEPDRARAFAILERAVARGIARIDTAPVYGTAEAWIGEFLVRHPGSLAVTTKLPAVPEDLPRAATADFVERALSESLRRLASERIDALLIHRARDLARLGDTLVAALDRERDRGRVARIGLSAYTPDDARRLLEHPALTLLQHPLSLLDRRLLDDPVRKPLREAGVGIEARSILLQGLLTLDPADARARRLGAGPALAALGECLAAAGFQAAAIALPFVLAAGADAALIGVDSAAELDAQLDALETPVPSELLDAIRALPAAAAGIVDPRVWPA